MTSGDDSGTRRRAFLYTLGGVAVLAALINTSGVISHVHNAPDRGLMGPIVGEASSWATIVLFFWIPWIGFRLGPPLERPSWRLLVHLPAVLAYSSCHVGGFVLLRTIFYQVIGAQYHFGPVWRNFAYEFGKDALAYVSFIAAFAFVEHLLSEKSEKGQPKQRLTFDIRDGTKLSRVKLADIVAVMSAGNYVEFVMSDGRRLCMRSSLSALESELQPHGFLRTHRSWLVNINHVTAINPEGSGDYCVSLGTVSVPLSRRFPEALAKLRAE